MKRLRMRKNYKISKVLIVVLILIFFLTFLLFKFYSEKVTPKIIEVAEVRIKRFTESFLSNNIGYDILNGDVIEDILVINKNDDGEILYVDYNLDQAYLALDTVTEELNNLLVDLENGYVEDDTDNSITGSEYGLILELPMFIASDSALLANLGPKIYMKVNFVGSLLTNIKSQIVDYGMNNALVELYVTIKITEELISPVTKSTQEVEYDVLIASKVINGRVPTFYGGKIVEESSLLSIPIE